MRSDTHAAVRTRSGVIPGFNARQGTKNAQELDLRNFFQHVNILFWSHPVWKIPEDKCFYVSDFAFFFVQDNKYTTSQPVDSLPLHCPPGIIRNYIPWFIHYLGDHVTPKNKKWEIYGEMVERTAQAQPLTAQELDIRNFFQHYQVQFWVHPVWKITEDHCFYVYDFAFSFTPSTTPDIPTTPSKLRSDNSLSDDLWLLECSYTTSKPGNAKQFFRKRSSYIDRKFRAVKRRGISTVLLLEALHVPPQDLYLFCILLLIN